MASLEKVVCEQPKEKRYLTTDSTIEKLGEICRDNKQLLVMRDELVGWFNSLCKSGREEDRTFYLQGWNGDSKYTFDRIGRGKIVIKNLCLSVFGTIQPDVIDQFIHGKKAFEDGLIQRFQMMVYPDQLEDFKNIDRAPDIIAEQKPKRVFTGLSGLTPRKDAATGEDVPEGFRCDSEAQVLMSYWIEEFEKRNRFEDFENSAMKLHYSKYPKLMASLALNFLMIDNASGSNFAQVQPVHVAMAGAWAEHLESHAKRIYSLEGGKKYQPHLTLLKMIKTGQIDSNSFRAWEVARLGRSGLNSPAAVKEVARKLEEYGWVKIKKGNSSSKGGRPSETITVHPDFNQFPLQSDFSKDDSNQPSKWLTILRSIINNPAENADNFLSELEKTERTEKTSPAVPKREIQLPDHFSTGITRTVTISPETQKNEINKKPVKKAEKSTSVADPKIKFERPDYFSKGHLKMKKPKKTFKKSPPIRPDFQSESYFDFIPAPIETKELTYPEKVQKAQEEHFAAFCQGSGIVDEDEIFKGIKLEDRNPF